MGKLLIKYKKEDVEHIELHHSVKDYKAALEILSKIDNLEEFHFTTKIR